MSRMTDYLENLVYNWNYRNTDMPGAPNSLFYGLHTANPGDDGQGFEVSGNGYARVEVTTGTAGTGAGSGFTAPTDGAGDNVGAVTFPTPTGGGWGHVGWISENDAASAGNALKVAPIGAFVKLEGAITSGATTLTTEPLPISPAFPTSGAFRIIIDAEILEVTAGQGTITWTVTRGVGGSTPAAHSDAAEIVQARLIQGGDQAPSFAAGALDVSFA
jgi:hypothetical protein